MGTRDDTLARITIAYRKAVSNAAKLGPALGIAVLRSGLSFDLISEDIGYSKQTVYTWIFGRAYPHHSTHDRVRKLTDLLEKATAKGGYLPVLEEMTLLQERELLKQVRARYDATAVS